MSIASDGHGRPFSHARAALSPKIEMRAEEVGITRRRSDLRKFGRRFTESTTKCKAEQRSTAVHNSAHSAGAWRNTAPGSPRFHSER